MLRRLFTLASALSLVLCAAALIALPLSYGWPVKIGWLHDFYGFIWKRQWAIVSYEGTVEVRRFLPDFPDYQAKRVRRWDLRVLGGVGYSCYEGPRSRGWLLDSVLVDQHCGSSPAPCPIRPRALAAFSCSAESSETSPLRLRPPRHTQPLPGMRHAGRDDG